MEILGGLAYYVVVGVIFVPLAAGIYRLGGHSRWWMFLNFLLAVIATGFISLSCPFLYGNPHETESERLFQLLLCMGVWSLASWLGSKWVPEAPWPNLSWVRRAKN
jgi:hypothetical protein